MFFSHKCNSRILLMLVIPVLFTFTQCANKSSPTGGPRDETPPELLESTPVNGQLNFNEKEIFLQFNEDVRVEKAKENIIITPRIDGEYDIKARRDRIILTFDSAFDANTTYTINFRESIVDITESNPAERLSLAFSTGPYIDSLSITGYVQHVLSGQPANKATVSLYYADDTTSVLDGLPVYSTETNDSGRYELRNLKSTGYRIYSVQDANRNLTAETGSEPYGFYPDTLQLTQDLSGINMNLVFLDIGPFKRISARPVGTAFDIRLNKYITEYSLSPADSGIQIYHSYSGPEHEIITIYRQGLPLNDSTRIFLNATDSTSQQLSDTVWVKFEQTSRNPDPLSMEVTIPNIPTNNPLLDARIDFSKPILRINGDSIRIYLDSLHQLSYETLSTTWNDTRTQLNLSLRFADSLFTTGSDPESANSPKSGRGVPNQKPPSLDLGRGAFISVENDTTESRQTALPFVNPSGLAILIFNITASTDSYFLQLIDTNGNVVEEQPAAETIRFRNLPPGEYQLRAVIDVNQNGKWDPGNILENQLPENIVYYTDRSGSTVITLRANFDVTERFSF